MNDITNLEIWILKWIVAPFIGVLLIFTLSQNSLSINECKRTCHEQGYADYKHKAP